MWQSNISRRWILKWITLEYDVLTFGKELFFCNEEGGSRFLRNVGIYLPRTHGITSDTSTIFFVVSYFDSSLWLFPTFWKLNTEYSQSTVVFESVILCVFHFYFSFINCITISSLLRLLCCAGNFGTLWSACGTHKIQHKKWRMSRYTYNYISVYNFFDRGHPFVLVIHLN